MELKKVLQNMRSSLLDLKKRIIVIIVGLAILCLSIFLAVSPKQKKDDFPGIEANRSYLEALIVPLETMPEWFYPYECPKEFRYSKEEILRMLPSPSQGFLEKLKAQRKAKVYEIISTGMH